MIESQELCLLSFYSIFPVTRQWSYVMSIYYCWHRSRRQCASRCHYTAFPIARLWRVPDPAKRRGGWEKAVAEVSSSGKFYIGEARIHRHRGVFYCRVFREEPATTLCNLGGGFCSRTKSHPPSTSAVERTSAITSQFEAIGNYNYFLECASLREAR